MSNWNYLTKEEKERHELYEKRTALSWFFVFLNVSIVLSFLNIMGQFNEHELIIHKLSRNVLNDLRGNEFYLIKSIPIIYTIFFVFLMTIFGKSKKTVVALIVLLVTLPIVGFISSSIFSQRFELYNVDNVTGFVMQAFFSVIFILVFGVYSLFSKTFNLQYLGRVKEI